MERLGHKGGGISPLLLWSECSKDTIPKITGDPYIIRKSFIIREVKETERLGMSRVKMETVIRGLGILSVPLEH